MQDLWLGFEASAARAAPRAVGGAQRAPAAPARRRGSGWTSRRSSRCSRRSATRLEVVWRGSRAADRPARPGPSCWRTRGRIAAEGGAALRRRDPSCWAAVGLSGWAALALADTPGLAGVLALAPSLARAGQIAPSPSPLRAALAGAPLVAKPPEVPLLVVEGRERPAPEARVVAEWVTRVPAAALLVVPGPDAALFEEPWLSTITSWARRDAGRSSP